MKITSDQLRILNNGLDAVEKSTNRAITISTIPAMEQALKSELSAIQETRVLLNQPDFFKS